ncbi:MAG: DUF2267 domain-containing protein [Cyanobacteria bacterium J083]|nr:MAG: DUF2267 domain-containing protein [Cyanobacteria bacterium J083]
MSETGLEVFDTTLHKTNKWLKEIREELHLSSRREAYHILRTVLHRLRDRMTLEEVAQMSAQLPMLIRGIFFEGWDPSGKPERVRHLDEFLQPIQEDLHQLGLTLNPRLVVQSVFKVLNRHISRGEIEEVRTLLPHEIRKLWPEPSTAEA